MARSGSSFLRSVVRDDGMYWDGCGGFTRKPGKAAILQSAKAASSVAAELGKTNPGRSFSVVYVDVRTAGDRPSGAVPVKYVLIQDWDVDGIRGMASPNRVHPYYDDFRTATSQAERLCGISADNISAAGCSLGKPKRYVLGTNESGFVAKGDGGSYTAVRVLAVPSLAETEDTGE